MHYFFIKVEDLNTDKLFGWFSDSCKYQMNCYNGGYTNPNNCYQCKCPSGLGGRDCLSVEKSSKFFSSTRRNSFELYICISN